MYITQVSVKNLHGFINARLKFDAALAIVVGINGTGKTSILNLTAHLLRLNLVELMKIKFSRIEIRGQHGKERILVTAVRRGGDLVINATLNKSRPIRVSIQDPFAILGEDDVADDRYTYERAIRRVQNALASTKLPNFLRSRVRLTLLRLDRTLFAEDFSGNVSVDMPAGYRARSASAKDTSIAQVERVTREHYTVYRNELAAVQEKLKNRIVLLLFEGTDFFPEPHNQSILKAPSELELGRLEANIKRSSFYPEDVGSKERITRYFSVSRKLFSEFKSSRSSGPKDWRSMLLRSASQRVRTIRTLLDEFQDFDEKSKVIYQKVGRYLDVVNIFLADSKKEAFFNESDNSLKFRVIGEPDSGGRRLSELSSGEKQVVTMLTFLAFMAGNDSMFVVDEPELSLHLAWQQNIVSAMQGVCPENCQLILATHSPEVVGRARKNVVHLVPTYSV